MFVEFVVGRIGLDPSVFLCGSVGIDSPLISSAFREGIVIGIEVEIEVEVGFEVDAKLEG
jgi:hypothetical protein